MKYGDLSYDEKDYYGASLYYAEALRFDTTNTEILFKYCHSLRLFNDYKLAEKYFSYLFKLDKGEKYPEVLFWFATMQKNNAKYIDARHSFQNFLELYKDKDSFLVKKASQEVKSCTFALQLIKAPVNVSVKNLGKGVNSENADFASVFATDSVLFFSSLRTEKNVEVKEKENKKYRVHLYKASRSNLKWKLDFELDSILNNAGYHVANGSFGLDKRYFYFSVCDSNYNCRIYFTKLTPSGWLSPHPLNDNINLSGFTSTQPSIANVKGKEVLLFVSDRPGGIGKLDIWYAVKESVKDFSDPVNLGTTVNTIDNEVSPWYDSDSSYLYFSSEWHYGLGGFDIFRSKGDLMRQLEPENLGYPLNSSANDFYFSLNDSKPEGTLSSNRIGSITKKAETCCNDIWSFEFPKLNLDKKDSLEKIDSLVADLDRLNSSFPIALYFHNDEPGRNSRDTVTGLNYEETYLSYIELKNKYREEYLGNYRNGGLEEKERQLNAFFDERVEKGYSDLNQFLNQLLESLKKGRRLTVAVRGHASPLSTSDYNVNLSKRRISSFINYLKNYDKGAFRPFLKDSLDRRLKVVQLPMGEYEADATVSDSYFNQRLSVYSPEAAKERRVEVVYVVLQEDSAKLANALFSTDKVDFGVVKSGEVVDGVFKFRNVGNRDLLINKVSASCGCTAASYTKRPVKPGEEGEVHFKFDSNGKVGKQMKKIIIETNGPGSLKELYIIGEVKP